MVLQRILDQLNVNQTEGIFDVPDVVKEDPCVDRFAKKLILKSKELPLVVREETYHRTSLERRLMVTTTGLKSPITRLAHYGVLRPKTGDDFSYHTFIREPVRTLSIAQLISWIFCKPIEQIWIPRKVFKEEKFKQKDATEQVKTLFNAYRGTSLLTHLENVIEKYVEKAPTVKEWQRISLERLKEFFPVSYEGTIFPLFAKGFFIPLYKKFVHKSPKYSLIDTVALAQFIALLYNKELDDILTRTEDDTYLKKLVQVYITKRLLPFLKDNNIDPIAEYTIGDAGRKVGKPYRDIYYAIQGNVIRHTKFERGDTRVRGIDLAIYKLRKTNKKTYTKQDVLGLFGVENLDFSHLDMIVTERETVSPVHCVYPVYNLISDSARGILLNELKQGMHTNLHYGAIPIPIEKNYLFITESAQQAYCREYRVRKFTNQCADYIRNQLEKCFRIGGITITTNEFTLTVRFGKYITDLRRL